MMFRNTREEEEDEESGSDWDDLSPRSHVTSQTPPMSARGQGSPPVPSRHKTAIVASTEIELDQIPVAPGLGALAGYRHSSLQDASSNSPHTPGRNLNRPVGAVDASRLTSLVATPPSPHGVSGGAPSLLPQVEVEVGRVYEVAREEATQTQLHPPATPTSGPPMQEKDNEVFYFMEVSESGAGSISIDHTPTDGVMKRFAIRSEHAYVRCAVELFSCLRLVSDCLIVFCLECLHYLLFHVLQKLCCGAARVCVDSCYKPALSLAFSSLLWPLCACLWHVGRACHMCLGPCCLEVVCGRWAEGCRGLLGAFRLVDVHTHHQHTYHKAHQHTYTQTV